MPPDLQPGAAGEAPPRTFDLEDRGLRMQVQQHLVASQVLYRIVFSEGRSP
ncbi:MAG TPA: hypothetical protein VG870_02420 [Chitinophagaceae bacterium]|nr:hypothetical protein [Chitinophagaceae bacterium]